MELKEYKKLDEYSRVEEAFINCYTRNKNKPLRILVGLYRGHYHQFLLSGVFFALKHACVWVLPIVTANIINVTLKKGDNAMNDIMWNIIVILALLALNMPMNYLYTRNRSKAARYVETGLRGAMVRKLQQLSISYHKDTQSGRLQSKIMRDVEAVETLSQQLFTSLLNIALNLVIALSITVSKSLVVFLFFLLAAPVAAITSVAYKSKIKKSNSEFRKEMEETSASVMEMVELIPVTRAHALEQEEIEKMQGQLNKVADKGYRLDIIQANFGAISFTIFQIFQILCLAFTGYLALNDRILVGDITLYQTYFATVVGQVASLINLLPVISKGLESVNSVGEVLLSEDIEEEEGKKVVDEVKGAFTFESVEFAYDESKPVLSGLNLTVQQGETIALVGESGAGKSTILNLVIGFNKANKGRVLLDGTDLNAINLRSFRRHLAVVPQSSILFTGTIRDNITYGMPNVTEEQLNRALAAANLNSFIANLPEGLDTRVGERGDTLSGGQKQRISIARALIRDPKVIVLDEATSALDSISEREIQCALTNLTKGRTTFIVAHRLSTIRNADKIAVINGGVCKEYGTFEELMALQGEFYQMRQLQS